MTFVDRVYDQISLESPVLEALITSPTLQRLKGIAQVGVAGKNGIPGRLPFSRFEHSVGVMLLLRQMGASEAEQIAGLLHDVSHTAFSHTIDWALGSGSKEDFQDSQYERILLRSEIPAILDRHGYHIDSFRDLDQFPLLEQPAPRLCADRMDYSYRESDPTLVRRCVADLVIHDGRFGYKTEAIALEHAQAFLVLQNKMAGFETTARCELFGQLLRYALKKEVIVFEDVWGVDADVLTKLAASTDPVLVETLAWFDEPSWETRRKRDEVAHPKFRFIDPDVLVEGQFVPLSQLSVSWREELNEARRAATSGVPLIHRPQITSSHVL